MAVDDHDAVGIQPRRDMRCKRLRVNRVAGIAGFETAFAQRFQIRVFPVFVAFAREAMVDKRAQPGVALRRHVGRPGQRIGYAGEFGTVKIHDRSFLIHGHAVSCIASKSA